jgi:multidrug resistance protein
MMVSTMLVAIDSTALAPAVVSITDEIGGFSSFPWLFSIYLLTSAVTVPIYSKLADTVGRKPIILIGIAIFLLGSILCAVAWSMPALIVARAIQGIGGGAILPVTITIIGDIYSVAERAKVQGYTAGMWAVAAVVGPTLGGVFAQLDAWRWIFIINIPLGAIAMWFIITRYHEQVHRRRHRIDLVGAALLTLGSTAIVLGVLEGGQAWAWNSVPSIVVFAVGALALVGFVLVERRAAEPVLPLPMLARPIILANVILGFAIGAGLIGLTAFIPTYLEIGAGVSPLIAGLALATFTIGWPIAATLSGRIYLRFGFRATTILGGVIVVLGALALVALAATPSVLTVAIVCLFVGAGFGFASVPSLIAAQSSVAWGERGVVTGTIMFSRSLGQAIGAAILGAVANAVIASRGGDEYDPGTIVAATTAVFIGVAIAAVVILVGAIVMPKTHTVAEEAGAGPAPEPDPVTP